jgi:hypothetical protein
MSEGRPGVSGSSGFSGLTKSTRQTKQTIGIECDIETGLSQSQAKEFALAGAVFDQRMEWCATILIIREHQ